MKLEEIFGKVLRLPVTTITDGATMSTLKRWDSFNHIQLVSAIERAYKIRFTTAEISAIKSVSDVRETLRRKGVAT